MARGGRPRKANWSEGATKKKQAGVSDMTMLSKINNESINDNLKQRFHNGDIYTYIGNVLISVNPFKDLGIYTHEILKSYENKNRMELPPHVYAIAEGAFRNMIAYKESQCVIISGESGAGKTEAAKKIMEYIAAISGGNSSSIKEIKDMVLATNPLLESFGCAKTLRNNNSSRHGKYLEIQFNSGGEPVGAIITNYLLEKGRVVGQIANERNFHIFYQFTKAASQTYRDNYGISGPESYLYTSAAGCLEVPNINDVQEYADTLKAMNVIGISQAEQDQIHCILATILWLGNATFVEDSEGNSAVSSQDVTNFIAYLLECSPEMVNKMLVSRTIETARGGRRGSIYDVPLNTAQALSARDGLAKAMYDRLFDWIVMRVNKAMQARSESSFIIGVLDIYGFEIFDQNSFEQLCINYVNEKLQQIFIELTLKAEQEEYVREQIKWSPIDYFNNKIVCDLIEAKRPPGVFAAMNDACATAHADPKAADNSLSQRLSACTHSKHFELYNGNFKVKHYAGDVTYSISGMTDKNKDQLLRDHLELCKSSKNNFLQILFPEPVAQDSKKRPPTASDRIKQSANELVTKLMQSQPSYIRTIKPNENKSPTEFNEQRVLHQVKYLGLCENIRIRRAGFAYRQTFEKFVERFYLLSSKTSYAGDYIWTGDSKSACVQILRDTGIAPEEWQIGTTKAFIRHPETIWALENQRDLYWHNMASRIQGAWRKYLARKAMSASKIQRAWRGKRQFLELLKIREKGHQLLDGKKERQRHSLTNIRVFYGDYLYLNNCSSQSKARLIRDAAGIGNQRAIFSLGITTLVPRSMRSAIPMRRILVVTVDSIVVIDERLVNNLLQHVAESKTPISTVQSVSMSPYKDGWMVIHVNGKPDMVLECNFKTELLTMLNMASQGRIRASFNTAITYNNKKMKQTQIKFVKDEGYKHAVFEKKVVRVGSGEHPSSRSQPLVEKSTGGHGNSGMRQRPNVRQQQQQQQRQQAPRRPSASNHTNGNATNNSFGQQQAAASAAPTRKQAAPPPPAPPPAPPAVVSRHPRYKALYDFPPQNAGELGLEAGKVYEIIDKNSNGWWLGLRNGIEGWIPSNYLSADPEPETPARQVPAAPVLPRPQVLRNGSGGGSDLAASQQNGSMALLAAALASGSPTSAKTPGNGQANAPARPGINRFAQEDSDDEEAWE
ncbi:class II myosin [Coemansia sp. RSA 1813]|nr:class II myosin [Coemansia sp. RSA 1843]KAJ2215808.1 class II myosin [Coemansia sp. RSA 487]KAJ2571739.1 class II myosin [Coemansia sp. RSA 1813]